MTVDYPFEPAAISPMPVRYKGYHFRSRTEARWAIVFEHLNLAWEYEVDGFNLPSGPYLPDFWLPSNRFWVEIKPPHAGPDIRWRELVQLTGHDMFIFFGSPGFSKTRGFLTRKPLSRKVDDFSEGRGHLYCDFGLGTSDVGDPQIIDAYNAARSARFEHGQSGPS